MATFSHLIRFEADDGKTYYGDLTKETLTRKIQGKEVEVLEGDVKSGFSKNGSKAKVSKLLCPLPTTNIILYVGLNYRQHAEECNVSYPTHPSNPAIFMKPSDALAGPLDTVPIHADCQSVLDYAKSFNKFAPIGPCINAKEVISDPQKLRY